jgi:hypothetical protein
VPHVDIATHAPDIRPLELASLFDALVRFQRTNVVVIDIIDCPYLGDNVAQSICDVVAALPNLRRINFSEDRFSEESTRRIRHAIADRSEQRVIARAMDDIRSGNVVFLTLRNKGLHDAAVLVLTDVIDEHCREAASGKVTIPQPLRTVDLRDNELTDESARSILRLLDMTPNNSSSLVQVSLEGNPSIQPALIQHIQKLCALRKRNHLAGVPLHTLY